MKDEANRIENVPAVQELAERFRELGRQLQKYTEHSDEPLSALRGFVDEDLPWQAGSYLCDAFDQGLIEPKCKSGEHVTCDQRYGSPLWCKERLESQGICETAQQDNDHVKRNAVADGETPEGLRRMAANCEWAPSRDLKHLDRYARIFSWWRFIRIQLSGNDRFRTRLGSTLDDHMPYLDVLDGILHPKAFCHEELFCGDTSDEKDRYRLRTAAQTQAAACEIVAELLGSKPDPPCGVGGKAKTKAHGGKRGRPTGTPKSDADLDRRINEAWKTGQYKRKAELDAAFDLKIGFSHDALERERKRKKKPAT